jgi:multiple sugar transport system substrate-binding protein
MTREIKHKLTTNYRLLATAALLALPLLGVQCRLFPQKAQEAVRPITLKYWRVFDDADTLAPTIANYRTAHPNITVEYRKLRSEEYERELIQAFAEDRGPDILSIHASSIRRFQPLLTPLPPQLTVGRIEIRGTLKKEAVPVVETKPSLTLRQLQTNFVDVVHSDIVIPVKSDDPAQGTVERIYGLPLAVDTLAMFYNRDLLDKAGIAEPPKTWGEFQQAAKRLTKLDAQGNVIQAGAALGTGANVERAADLVALLMMQNGTQMTDENGFATFNLIPATLRGRPAPPGEEAVVFYTDFANPTKEVYTWNLNMPNSMETFVTGRSAFFFGYSYHIPTIRTRAPKLDLGIAKVPQIEGNPETNYANYWVESVSKKSAHPHEAWDFIQFATTAQQAPNYLAAAKHPTALRALIGSQLEDLDLGIFASQVLTAKSWYRGKDPVVAEKALGDLVDAAVKYYAPLAGKKEEDIR